MTGRRYTVHVAGMWADVVVSGRRYRASLGGPEELPEVRIDGVCDDRGDEVAPTEQQRERIEAAAIEQDEEAVCG